MSNSEKEVEKLYYSISEVSTMLSVNASLIRFWEKKFPYLKPLKNKKGDRLFTSKDIEKLREIYSLVKDQGFKLEGAKRKIKAKNIGDVSINTSEIETEKVIDTLNKARTKLLKLKISLG